MCNEESINFRSQASELRLQNNFEERSKDQMRTEDRPLAVITPKDSRINQYIIFSLVIFAPSKDHSGLAPSKTASGAIHIASP